MAELVRAKKNFRLSCYDCNGRRRKKRKKEEKQEVESYRIMKKKWKDLVAKLAKRKEQAEVEAVAEEEAGGGNNKAVRIKEKEELVSNWV